MSLAPLHAPTPSSRRRPSRLRPLAALLALGLAGCNLAPTTRVPPLAVPTQIQPAFGSARATPAEVQWDEAARSPGLAWQSWVQDERLRQVLTQALTGNRDLQQAVLNVERARAVYGITRADQLPSVGLSAQGSRARTAADLSSSGRAVTQEQYSVQLGITAFELDFWGRVRNLSEASLQQVLAQGDTQQNVRLALLGDTTQAWLNLAADLHRLRLAEDTLAAREKAFRLTQRMHELGATSGLVLAQNQTTVDSARLDVAAYRTQIAKDRHALALLAGGPVPEAWLPTADDTLATTVSSLADVPGELPSTMLLRRPDVQAAEHRLRAMNANIGVARANFFPRISLTAAVGTASRSLSALFDGGNGTWSFAPGLSLPLFDGGANRANLRVAEVDRDLAVNAYDRAVQTAFKEVADALAERQSWQERLTASAALVSANQRALDLSNARFKAGTDDYLAVLDAQRSLYTAQQQHISLQLAEQLGRVALYKALGGDAVTDVVSSIQ
ncbi:transporter [Comamonas serinivorans]|uniref:Transporter n=1 Tax=Comamonas serinivorans TaxID=1082851 RepID=A0A1Y0EJL1_9BURK|nr:efflux transporter outer membrane subunit [Comamonas serinivorans]ARU03618.1 transporter [Comamonas serinivorans]